MGKTREAQSGKNAIAGVCAPSLKKPTDNSNNYAGDIDARDAFRVLTDAPEACLVDVRSQSEWSFVGVPDLAGLGKDVIFIEWQAFPSMARNERFADTLSEELGKVEASRPVFFLCRSGQRSRAAAIAASAARLGASYNIADGFEGPCDTEKHRGQLAGWKAAGLPWTQS